MRQTRFVIWLACVIFILTIIFGIALPVFCQYQQQNFKRACFANLCFIDHGLNCTACSGLSQGSTVDIQFVKDSCPFGLVPDCPLGAKYNIPLIVGEHPSCPIHGDLIRLTGHTPHGDPGKPLPLDYFPPWLQICLLTTLTLCFLEVLLFYRYFKSHPQTFRELAAKPLAGTLSRRKVILLFLLAVSFFAWMYVLIKQDRSRIFIIQNKANAIRLGWSERDVEHLLGPPNRIINSGGEGGNSNVQWIYCRKIGWKIYKNEILQHVFSKTEYKNKIDQPGNEVYIAFKNGKVDSTEFKYESNQRSISVQNSEAKPLQ